MTHNITNQYEKVAYSKSIKNLMRADDTLSTDDAFL